MAATDEKAIHEFPTGTIDDNSLLIMDRPTATPGEYETEKFAIANLGLKLLGGIDFPSNLDTDEQDIFGAINEVNAKAMNIAAEYDETASYSKGNYCIYQNAAYRCIKASGTTTGTFVAADWTQIKVLTEVKSNSEAINELDINKADISDIPTKTSDLSNDSGFPVSTNISWGQSLSINYIKSNFLLFVSNRLFALWFYGIGYANVDIRNLGTNDVSSGTGSVTMDIITVTRTADGFTVTTTSQATLTVIG